jgi:predicted phage terminase large subunit-like protein
MGAIKILSVDPRQEYERVEAAQTVRHFSRFVRKAWPLVDPAPLIWNWHLDVLCDHLQAVAEGRIRKLAINIPPGHAKSMIVSVLYPAWRWARDPSWQVMTSSYEIGLATRDAIKSRELIESAWYKKWHTRDRRSPDPDDTWALVDDQNVKSFYKNTSLGFRLCLSVGGKGTGYRGDALIIDDPLNALDANSKLKRDEVINWKTATMSSRFNDQETAEEILIMQRLHEDDLTGYLKRAGGWQHLVLMSEFEPKRRSVTYAKPKPPPEVINSKFLREQWLKDKAPVKFWSDPRKEHGELLFPAKFPAHVLAEAKSTKGMGPIAYAGQHGQSPVPSDGGMLKRAWFARQWHFPGDEPILRAEPFENLLRREYNPRTSKPHQRIIVTDAAFKKTSDSDRVAIIVADVIFPDVYVLDWAWRRMGIEDTIAEILALRKKWSIKPFGHVTKVGVEDKANGPAIIELLKKKIPSVHAIEPYGSKEARIAAGAPFIQSGNVWLPEAHVQLDDAVSEAIGFPKASNDDWIDALSYVVILTLLDSDTEYLERLCKWR